MAASKSGNKKFNLADYESDNGTSQNIALEIRRGGEISAMTNEI